MFDYNIDLPAIDFYNNRRKLESKTRLQTHMQPAPFDGDPFKAAVVLLMNNPTYGPNSSPKDHSLRFDGWPLAGLHPEAPCAFRDWYNRPLGFLIETFGRQHVSQCVAIVQINPWASESFDSACILPSRQQQIEIARQAVQRGAVTIIGRSIQFWRGQLGEAENIYATKSYLNPTLSPGGLAADAFDAVIATLTAKKQ
jgi:hypothetical protein